MTKTPNISHPVVLFQVKSPREQESRLRGTQENEVSGHADFQGQPQSYLPTSQNYVHEQNYCQLQSSNIYGIDPRQEIDTVAASLNALNSRDGGWLVRTQILLST